eukprot:gnl/TRDRNA2_/TRDRNA2_161739_c0_seq3.p2 gnl/TRDRNA2_/TRDRNA2_161739_c0~~gnl/TRDRNA2_/TRDRNA2_161739_c0_seq3.p2  ORF type:complete len:144 (+),score=31.83 gnl/TRDRNA2_/TRDRNA2_161739_c0_seq3:89-520(+)
MVGYTGGENPKPTYETVCDGDGHTEAIKIDYDPDQTTYKELLEMFWIWKEQHGTIQSIPQYKAAIWYHNDEQKQEIETSMQAIAASTGRTPQVDVFPATAWHDAEEYHQKYYKKLEGEDDDEYEFDRRLTAVTTAKEVRRGGC